MEIREATNDDTDFLAAMALRFAHLPQSHAVADWLDPNWDVGLVALEEEGSIRVEAAWWRAFRGVVNGELNPDIREVYLAVDDAHGGKGYASALLNKLIERARNDAGIKRLMGRVVLVHNANNTSEPCLRIAAWLVRPLAAHLLRFPPLRDQEDPRRDGLIFYGERGGPIRRHSFRKSWERACAAAGLQGMRVEWLRHSGASIGYLATRDLKAVAARLGYTSTRMVDMIYIEQYAEVSRAVADAIDALVQQTVSD